MSYSEQITKSPSLIKRFSHNKRFDIALDLLSITQDDDILDYGTGDGFMLRKLLSKNPRSVVGYERFHDTKDLNDILNSTACSNVKIINDMRSIKDRLFDKVYCLEVLEHVTEENQIFILKEIKSILKSNGVVIISVPIEVGISGMIKFILRFFLRQSHQNSSLKNAIKSLFGIKINRGEDEYICTHVGFDYRDLEKTITGAGYKVKEKSFSPFRSLKWFINSQVFFVLELK